MISRVRHRRAHSWRSPALCALLLTALSLSPVAAAQEEPPPPAPEPGDVNFVYSSILGTGFYAVGDERETLLVQVQQAGVAEAGGHGDLGAGGADARNPRHHRDAAQCTCREARQHVGLRRRGGAV